MDLDEQLEVLARDLLPSLGKEIEDLALRIGDVDVSDCY